MGKLLKKSLGALPVAARGEMEKTAEADCDEKIKMETCLMESPVCEAISYCSDAYDRRFTNETGHTKVKSICDRYKHSKPSTCAESGCKAFIS